MVSRSSRFRVVALLLMGCFLTGAFTLQPRAAAEEGPAALECSTPDAWPVGDDDLRALTDAQKLADVARPWSRVDESDVPPYAVDIVRERKHGS